MAVTRLRRLRVIKLNRELGIWELCATRWLRVAGTTPVNADIWTLRVDLGTVPSRPGVWLKTGRHWGIQVWLNSERYVAVHRRPGRCRCWGCTGARTRLRRRQKPGWDVETDLRRRKRNGKRTGNERGSER